jgi:dTDP-glucose pyrophosphorylase
MKAIILAAGNSTRYGENKLLVEFQGKNLIQHNIDFCVENGLTDICITISKEHTEIYGYDIPHHPIISTVTKYVKNKYPTLNPQFKFQDTKKYGPAAGLLPWLDGDEDNILVLFGDNFYQGKVDFSLVKERGVDAVASYKMYERDEDNLRLAAVDMETETLLEKPHHITSGAFFCGYIFFSPKGFSQLRKLQPSTGRGEYEITELFNSVQNRKLQPVIENWTDLTYKIDDRSVNDFIAKAKSTQ